MTLNAKIGIFNEFSISISGCDTKSFTRWCHGTGVCGVRGVIGFRLKRNYSTPGLVSTAMGDCLRAGTAIGFRASREH